MSEHDNASASLWQVPLLALGAILGLIGIGIGIRLEIGSAVPYLDGVPWALGGAAITFGLADAFAHKRLSWARLETILIGVGALVAPMIAYAALIALGIAILLALLGLF